MSFTRLSFTTLFAAVAAVCVPAQDKHELRYEFVKGTKAWFHMVQKTTMAMDMGGQKIDSGGTIEMFTKAHIKDVVDGKALLDFEFTRVKCNMQVPMMGNIEFDTDDEDYRAGMLESLADMVGSKISTSIDARGKASDVKLPDQAERAFQSISSDPSSFIQQIAAMLPEKPIAVGEKWESTQSMAMQMGSMEVKVENVLTKMDGSLATIQQKMNIDMSSVEMPMPMKIDVKKAEGSVVVDLSQGLMKEMTSTMQMTMKMEAEGQGMGMDMNMNMNMTMKRIPEPKKPEKKEDKKDGDK